MSRVKNDFHELGPVKLSQMFKERKRLQENIINDILYFLMDILFCEPNVYCLRSPIIVIGSLSGQLFDLFEIFAQSGDDFINAKSEPAKLNNSYLFLGNYVCRYDYSIETFIFLGLLKIKYPNQIYLLKGYRELNDQSLSNGLYHDCMKIYGHIGLWYLMIEVFNLLPIAAVIDKKIFCVHGGLSPKINFIGQISSFDRRKFKFNSFYEDLLFSKPSDYVNEFLKSPRDYGHYFGKQQTISFLYNNKLINRGDDLNDQKKSFIVCSHCDNEGYEWKHDNNLITIWSELSHSIKSAAVLKISSQKNDIFEFKIGFQNNEDQDDGIIEYFP